MSRAVLLLACVLAPVVAAAHEIGTTEVRLGVAADGRWSAVITTGPQALVNKLEIAAGRRPSAGLDVTGLRQQLEALLPAMASHLEVRFDGRRQKPILSIERLEVPRDQTVPAFLVIKATGERQPGAATVSWRDDLMYATYALVLERQGTLPATTWIAADADSGPMPLNGGRRTAFARVVVPASAALVFTALVLAVERRRAM